MDTVLAILHVLVNIFFQESLSYYYFHFANVVQSQILSIQIQTFLIPKSMDFSPYCTIFLPFITHEILIVICSINYNEERIIRHNSKLPLQLNLCNV